jgi:hypothetical protein
MIIAMQPNPYAPPKSATLTAPWSDLADLVAVRREHIGTEATIKSVGFLYYLGGFIIFLVGVASVIAADSGSEKSVLPMAVLLMALSIGQIVVGFGLRRLRGWARIPTIILSAIGLLAFPVGTLINGYILYKVLCKQGQFVMKEDYQRIIATTPHVKHRTSAVVWILLVAVIIAVLAAVTFLGMQAR